MPGMSSRRIAVASADADLSVNPAGEHRPDVEAGLRTELGEAGLKVGRIETEVRDIQPGDPRLRRVGGRFAERAVRSGGELIIAVEQPGHDWLVLHAPWPRAEPRIWYGAC